MIGWLREVPPTAGLKPRLCDLKGPSGAERFARGLADWLQTPEVILASSGTACLVVAFTSLKERSARRTVIVPAYTCPIVVHAAAAAGLRVRACDLVAGGFDLDLVELGRLIDDDTLCVVPTHFGGALADVAAVRSFVAQRSPETTVIEDAAQAFGARQSGAMAGFAGHIGVFSFSRGKGLTLYEGGCLVSTDRDIRENLRATAQRLLARSSLWEMRRAIELVGYHLLYNPFGLVFAYGASRRYWLKRGDPARAVGDVVSPRISLHQIGAWRAGVGLRALGRLDAHWIAGRARHDALAARLVLELPDVQVHRPAPSQQPVCSFLFVTLPTRARCEAALSALWRLPCGVSKLFAHTLGGYPQLDGKIALGATPNADDLVARTLTISTSEYLNARDIDIIVAALRPHYQAESEL
jgi:perosamine synthetase